MINIGNNFIVIENRWTTFKSFVQSKGLLIQYDASTDGNTYKIIAIDGVIVYSTDIWVTTIPNPDPNYSQVQNDLDKTDFETNFKPFANKSLVPKSNISLGYTTSSGSSLTAIRATAYAEQTTNAQRSIVSSNANDTSAGTGARTIKVTYYDQNLLGPFIETITMNGVTPVDTVSSTICFIEKIEVNTIGSQLSNVGTITLKAATSGGGATIGTIPAGDSITNWAHHYVGTNKVMTLISVIGSIKGSASGSLEIHKTIPTDVTKPELTIAPKLRIDAGDCDKLNFDAPIVIIGPALVLVYGRSDSSSGNIDWSVGLGYYEN